MLPGDTVLFDRLKVWIASAPEKPSGIFWGNRTKCLNKINIPRFLHWTLSSFVQFPRQHGTLFYFLKKSHIFVCLMRINDQLYIPWRVTNFLFAQMKKYVGGCNTEYDSINADLSSKKKTLNDKKLVWYSVIWQEKMHTIAGSGTQTILGETSILNSGVGKMNLWWTSLVLGWRMTWVIGRSWSNSSRVLISLLKISS